MAVLTANAHLFYREFQHREQNQMNGGCSVSILGAGFCSSNGGEMGKGRRRAVKRGTRWRAFWQEVSKPISVEMEPITGAEHLDQILQEAQQLSQPIVIDWMAAWCRKCIYLKPKLEKLAGEFHTEAKFYFVDVNKVSQALVKRGNISKMPTIQLWKDGEMKEEVIGGHKAWLVVDEVREMIRKYI